MPTFEVLLTAPSACSRKIHGTHHCTSRRWDASGPHASAFTTVHSPSTGQMAWSGFGLASMRNMTESSANKSFEADGHTSWPRRARMNVCAGRRGIVAMAAAQFNR